MAFSKIFSGIAHAVKSSDGTRSSGRHASYTSAQSAVDEYHTHRCNKINRNANIKVTLLMESPPIVVYGPPDESSGAPFNGALVLDVFPKTQEEQRNELEGRSPRIAPATSNAAKLEALKSTMSVSQLDNEQMCNDYVEMRSVKLWLIQVMNYGPPYVPASGTLQSCPDCRRKVTEMASWEVLSKRTAFAKGTSHSYPFGYLIPGDTPATSVLSNRECTISYELVCKATFVNSLGEEDLINLSLPIMIRRSVLRGHDRNSLRVFPPTDVTGTASIPNVSYPRSTFPVEIRMDNVATKDRRWRMRKLSWRVEESVRVRSHHCKRHSNKHALVVEFTKRKQAGRKLAKNSGGIDVPAYNYFFEAPQPPRTARVPTAAPEHGGNTAADFEGAGDPVVTRREGSIDSHMTGTTTAADVTPSNSNWSLNQSQSHNQIAGTMSATMTAAQANQLDDPNEIVMPIVEEEDENSPSEPELFIEEIRTLSSGEMKSGWKSDFSDKGRIEMVVEISVMDLSSVGFNSANANITTITSQNCESPLFDPSTYLEADANCACDIYDPKLGVYVSHNLIVEAVVAEEVVQKGTNYKIKQTSGTSRVMQTLVPEETLPQSERSTSENYIRTTHDGGICSDALSGNKEDAANHIQGIPTGVARVLRMQFKIVMTERSGMGVSWDDEVPPTYNKVGALSPPTYSEATVSNNTPLLSSLVIPLDGDESMTSERDQVVLTEPTVPPHAKVRHGTTGHGGSSLSPQMSELNLSSRN